MLLWDNVREPLGNSAIDSFLTSPTFADRILGVSENAELPNRALMLITGNNLVLTGDTHRRVLLARLDSKIENPFKREFDFDPLAEIYRSRQELVVAALTIVRAYITAGRPRSARGRIASFECWDDLVRQPLCWLKGEMIKAGQDLTGVPEFADPADAIDLAAAENPEISKLGVLLNAWLTTFGNVPTSPAQAITAATRYPDDIALREALDQIAGQSGSLNVRILGRWLERHSEQLCQGLRLELGNRSNGLKRWIVVRSNERARSDG